MKVIIIGMDNTGKTTLVDQLSQGMSIPHLKSPGPEISEDEQRLWVERQMQTDEIIHERFALFEEMVYGRVLRGRSNFSPEKFMELLGKLDQEGVIIIYCRPTHIDAKYAGVIMSTMNERPQMEGVVEKTIALTQAWDELYFLIATHMRKANVSIYNYINMDQEEEI